MNYEKINGKLWFETSKNLKIALPYQYNFLNYIFTNFSEFHSIFELKEIVTDDGLGLIDCLKISYDLASEIIGMIHEVKWLEQVNDSYFEN
ncbi:hypothetical protein [Spiroplasma clarkii]|uniref:Uncharacterized protein n=1 Tax=Spiroplasma clarkii TaxID=2139 RepID=A0A2K8KHB0_9MOLU|nr:hypothetical protein [Spiroplasma clarkii]ATX71060.1 hypothetical protein SCLAR_v1c07430 [Spiroplasma clarkii]